MRISPRALRVPVSTAREAAEADGAPVASQELTDNHRLFSLTRLFHGWKLRERRIFQFVPRTPALSGLHCEKSKTRGGAKAAEFSKEETPESGNHAVTLCFRIWGSDLSMSVWTQRSSQHCLSYLVSLMSENCTGHLEIFLLF